MHDKLVQRIMGRIPPFTETIAEGLAYEHMMGKPNVVGDDTVFNNTMAYNERVIRVNQVMFPKGLKFTGSRMCTAIEHFEKITHEYQSKRTANIAKHDTYMVEYNFTYDMGDGRGPVPLQPRYVLLPFVRPGGLMNLNGATYSLSPVLADIGYSVSRNSIFIPFRRAKLTFNRADYRYMVDGKMDFVHIIWSTVHQEIHNRKNSDRNKRQHIECSMAQYFFCEFGVKETFKRWGGADVEIVHRQDLKNYPKSTFSVYESCVTRKRHPAGDICLVIPKAQCTKFTDMLIGGFFYVADTFPDRFVNMEYIDGRALWRTILGMMVFGDFEHVGKLTENIDKHMIGFNNSLDEMTMDDLAKAGIHVKDIWHLLHHIMTEMAHHFYQTSRDETSMYGKQLTVLRYVMDEFNSAISLLTYGFQGRSDIVWKPLAIEDMLKKYLKLNTCIRLLTSKHNELSTVNYPGDNKIIRITSVIVPQDQARAANTHNRGVLNDPSRLLDASIAEIGQYKNQPKSAPDGRSRVGTHVQLGMDGTVIRREDCRELIDKTQSRIIR